MNLTELIQKINQQITDSGGRRPDVIIIPPDVAQELSANWFSGERNKRILNIRIIASVDVENVVFGYEQKN